ncbi:MAG: hypothetical protein ACTSXZ_05035 [Alphaproteobacteria bacterium]
MSDATTFDPGEGIGNLERLPRHIAASFTLEQRRALTRALQNQNSAPHVVNIRLSVPLLFKRYYMSIFVGAERRSAARRHAERVVNPLKTTGNMVFVIIAAIALYSAGVVGLMLLSSVVGL